MTSDDVLTKNHGGINSPRGEGFDHWPTVYLVGKSRQTDEKIKDYVCFYKALNGHLEISPKTVNLDLAPPGRSLRKQHNYRLDRLTGSDRNSPLWNGTVARTIPEWNSLPASIVEADSLTLFKSRLSTAAP